LIISNYGIFLDLIFLCEQVMKRQLKVVKNTQRSHRQNPKTPKPQNPVRKKVRSGVMHRNK
jgi:hypothetical protein